MKKNLKIFFYLFIAIIFISCRNNLTPIEYELKLTLSTDNEGIHVSMVEPISKAVNHELLGELLDANKVWVKRRLAYSEDDWDFVGYVQRRIPEYLYDTDCYFDDYYVNEGVAYEYSLEVSLYDIETHESTKLYSNNYIITAQGGYGETTFDSNISYTYNENTSLLQFDFNPELTIFNPEGVSSPCHIGVWNGERRYDWNHTLTMDEIENGLYLNDLNMPEIGYSNHNALYDESVNIRFWMEYTRFEEDGLINTWRILGDISGDICNRSGVIIKIPSK